MNLNKLMLNFVTKSMWHKWWLTGTYYYYSTVFMFATFTRRSYVIASASLYVDTIAASLSMVVVFGMRRK